MTRSSEPNDRQLARFSIEVNRLDRDIDIAKAALYIAQIEYPNLAHNTYLSALDNMAKEVERKLPKTPYPLRVIKTINQYLYDELNFHGNEDDYYDPRNSFLNEAIDRRTGIPITLSLIYLEIAKRIDFPMVGIGMPGHFLIRPDFEDAEIFVDAFNRGETLFVEDCRQKLIQLYQQDIPFLPPEMLQPVTNRQFLARMLNNLQAIYLNQGDFNRALTFKNWYEILIT
jgi:regulator of sirC expression with transglutaminase-like and TPR domain